MVLTKKTLHFLLLFCTLVFVSGCSNDEEENAINENGGQISRFQIVTIDFGGQQLARDTYEGVFNNRPINLAKVEESKLIFYVTESTPLGRVELLIPELNDAQITYEVVDAILTQTPDATLLPLENFQEQYGNSLTNDPEDAPFLQNHNSLTSYLANLSDEDRIKAAKFYKTNKSIFDAVYNTNYDAVQGRGLDSQTLSEIDFQRYRALINKHKLAVAVTVIAGVLAVMPPYELVETGLAAGVAIAGIKKSQDFHMEIVNDVFRVVGVELNNELGTNNRLTNRANSALSFVSNQLVTIPFTVGGRTINNADSNVQKVFMQTYFSAVNRLNGFINDLNGAIDWMNNNLPLTNLSHVNTVNVPNVSSEGSFDANAQLMQNFTFSVNHPNLSLETATLQTNGQLNLKINIIGTPSSIPINSTLNYTYNDDFNNFSGQFDIQVTDENTFSLVGTWVVVGKGAGTYDSATGTFSQYITSESSQGTCSSGTFYTYERDFTTNYSFSNIVITENSLSYNQSETTSGQFCDAAYGEQTCNNSRTIVYNKTLSATPFMEVNDVNHIIGDVSYVNNYNYSCSEYTYGNGTTIGEDECYCDLSYSTSNSGQANMLIRNNGDVNVIYVSFNGNSASLKLIRQ
jgi:hypothetical protein